MVELLGFDEAAISFRVSGPEALAVAHLCGDALGFVPNRTKAEVSVTLYGDALTPDFCTVTSKVGEDNLNLFAERSYAEGNEEGNQ